MRARPRQAGAALLAAMLTVTLVATFAASAMWQQWRAIEVETAERARVQSAWILVGALDWSRLILAEDRNAGGADYLAEPWAVPLEEARLSTFLAAEGGVAQPQDASTDTTDAFLSGQIIDLQSRLNLANLVVGGAVQKDVLAQFQRLFARLGLPATAPAALAEALRLAQQPGGNNADLPLMPQTLAQLTWLGLSPATVAVLEPHVTLLPRPTTVNLNTAGAEVLMACIDGLGQAGANKLLAVREIQYFRSVDEARALLGSGATVGNAALGVSSDYFEVRGRLRLGDVTVQERSLVVRDGATVRALWRERGATAWAGTAAAPAAP